MQTRNRFASSKTKIKKELSQIKLLMIEDHGSLI